MQTSGQLHVTASLLPGNKPLVPVKLEAVFAPQPVCPLLATAVNVISTLRQSQGTDIAAFHLASIHCISPSKAEWQQLFY